METKRLKEETQNQFDLAVYKFYERLNTELEQGDVMEVSEISSAFLRFINASMRVRALRNAEKEDINTEEEGD